MHDSCGSGPHQVWWCCSSLRCRLLRRPVWRRWVSIAYLFYFWFPSTFLNCFATCFALHHLLLSSNSYTFLRGTRSLGQRCCGEGIPCRFRNSFDSVHHLMDFIKRIWWLRLYCMGDLSKFFDDCLQSSFSSKLLLSHIVHVLHTLRRQPN